MSNTDIHDNDEDRAYWNELNSRTDAERDAISNASTVPAVECDWSVS